MTFRGHIQNGTIILDEPLSLPEGAEVTVDLVVISRAPQAAGLTHPTTGQRDPLWGLMRDEATLLDQIVEETMLERSRKRLRDVDVG